MSKSPHKLLVLTLALESAVLAENWDEMDALFSERAKVLGSPSPVEINSGLTESVREADRRIMQMLEGKRTDLVRELSQGRMGRKMAHTYAMHGSLGHSLNETS